MVRVVGVEDPPAARRAPGELERRLDRLGSGVPEVHPVEPGDPLDDRLGEQAGEEGAVELEEVREALAERVLERLPEDGVVVPDVRDAEARDAVEGALAVDVVEVAAFRPGVDLVVAGQLRDLGPRGVDVLGVELVILAQAVVEELEDVETHEAASIGGAEFEVNCSLRGAGV